MSLTDPIGDMIARIKNSQMRNHKKVELPSSNFKVKIADILKSEGFILDFKVNLENNKPIFKTIFLSCGAIYKFLKENFFLSSNLICLA